MLRGAAAHCVSGIPVQQLALYPHPPYGGCGNLALPFLCGYTRQTWAQPLAGADFAYRCAVALRGCGEWHSGADARYAFPVRRGHNHYAPPCQQRPHFSLAARTSCDDDTVTHPLRQRLTEQGVVQQEKFSNLNAKITLLDCFISHRNITYTRKE